MPNLADIAAEIAKLVVQRRTTWPDTEQLCTLTGLDPEVLRTVERLGTHAPLAHVEQYAAALGATATLRVVHHKPSLRDHRSCEMCGEAPTMHPQRHIVEAAACVDEGIAPLVIALHGVGIRTELSCEGSLTEPAHLYFPTLEDTRAFYALVDRADDAVRLRANLRQLTPNDIGHGGMHWENGVRWYLRPGSLLADAMCSVRFDRREIPVLTRLAQNPPAPSLSRLITAARPS